MAGSSKAETAEAAAAATGARSQRGIIAHGTKLKSHLEPACSTRPGSRRAREHCERAGLARRLQLRLLLAILLQKHRSMRWSTLSNNAPLKTENKTGLARLPDGRAQQAAQLCLKSQRE